MWAFLRRRTLFFLIGFVITFILYLFFIWDPVKVLLGVVVAAVVGVVFSWLVWILERRFPDEPRAEEHRA